MIVVVAYLEDFMDEILHNDMHIRQLISLLSIQVCYGDLCAVQTVFLEITFNWCLMCWSAPLNFSYSNTT